MITVCIATYNGSRYIAQQLMSILPQLGENDEIVISDDGSTDDTVDIIRTFDDRRIKIVENNVEKYADKSAKSYTDKHRNSSLIRNFENALRHANGDYIFLADQDDCWMHNKIEVCTRLLKDNYCIVSDAEVTDSILRPTGMSLYEMMKTKPGRLYNLLWHNGYTGCCMAFRREVLQKALPFPENIPMHDIWIGNVAAYFFNVRFTGERLIYFRRHQNATSRNGKGSNFSVMQKLSFRWNTIRHLIHTRLKQRKA